MTLHALFAIRSMRCGAVRCALHAREADEKHHHYCQAHWEIWAESGWAAPEAQMMTAEQKLKRAKKKLLNLRRKVAARELDTKLKLVPGLENASPFVELHWCGEALGRLHPDEAREFARQLNKGTTDCWRLLDNSFEELRKADSASARDAPRQATFGTCIEAAIDQLDP
jgi:hypothetical protein